MVKSGSTCIRITSKAECEKASIDLGLSGNVAEYETSGYPPYCYIWDNEVYFNDNGNADQGMLILDIGSAIRAQKV